MQEIVDEVEKHRLFYRFSGGGITFSGGEASRQFPFLDALSGALYDAGHDLCLESNGHFHTNRCSRYSSAWHCALSTSNIWIRLSIAVLPAWETKNAGYDPAYRKTDLPLVVRVPVIQTVNAEDAQIRAIARFVKEAVRTPASNCCRITVTAK